MPTTSPAQSTSGPVDQRRATGRWPRAAAIPAAGTACGLASAVAGRLLTVPVDTCGGVGRAGGPMGWGLWWLAAAATVVSLVGALVAALGAIDRAHRSWLRTSGVLALGALVSGASAVGGLVSNWGDTPLFCF
jgi:hypothetical protein